MIGNNLWQIFNDDNTDHWQIFNDDKHVIKFLTKLHEFYDFDVNEKEEGCNYTEDDNKSNPVPRRIIAQEKSFDRQDGHKRKEESKEKLCDHLEVNIGSDQEPRMIKVGKTTLIEERKEIVKFLREYRDVLAFNYDELKVYREDVIQHVIPLKEETKPFRQKLRQMNPKLAPLVLLTAGLAQRSTHFMKIIYVEDSRVLLGVFKHQHLYFCKRDLRTPARVIM